MKRQHLIIRQNRLKRLLFLRLGLVKCEMLRLMIEDIDEVLDLAWGDGTSAGAVVFAHGLLF
jgi:hypothetical protein